jgi:hypothetical protein
VIGQYGIWLLAVLQFAVLLVVVAAAELHVRRQTRAPLTGDRAPTRRRT